MKTKRWLAAIAAVALSGCATNDQFARYATSLSEAESKGLIANVRTEHLARGETDVTLTYLGNVDPRYPLGFADCESMALDAAEVYRQRLHAGYVWVVVNDPNGQEITRRNAGTPQGYHWQQDGIEWDNGPFGPVNVVPHYGLERD